VAEGRGALLALLLLGRRRASLSTLLEALHATVTYFAEPTAIMRLKNIRFDGKAMLIGAYMVEKQVTIIGCFGREWIFRREAQ
jgi:hypothetical protein